jgi:hypothetical protein
LRTSAYGTFGPPPMIACGCSYSRGNWPASLTLGSRCCGAGRLVAWQKSSGSRDLTAAAHTTASNCCCALSRRPEPRPTSFSSFLFNEANILLKMRLAIAGKTIASPAIMSLRSGEECTAGYHTSQPQDTVAVPEHSNSPRWHRPTGSIIRRNIDGTTNPTGTGKKDTTRIDAITTSPRRRRFNKATCPAKPIIATNSIPSASPRPHSRPPLRRPGPAVQ